MAGPWFTVHENGGDWQRLDSIWISDGETDCEGVIEIKLELESNEAVPGSAFTRPIANRQSSEQQIILLGEKSK